MMLEHTNLGTGAASVQEFAHGRLVRQPVGDDTLVLLGVDLR